MTLAIREAGTTYRYRNRLVPALLVIALGVFFLLTNFGVEIPFLDVHNWWAWFILLAAASPLSVAVERYRKVGSIDGVVQHSLLTATAIVMVALMFILDLSWQRWWPVFLIYGGLCMLTRTGRDRTGRDTP